MGCQAAAHVLPHDEEHATADEGVLGAEGVEHQVALLEDLTHGDVEAQTGVGVVVWEGAGQEGTDVQVGLALRKPDAQINLFTSWIMAGGRRDPATHFTDVETEAKREKSERERSQKSQDGHSFLFVCFCGTLVPRPGIESVPPAVEAWSLNHWTTREVPRMVIP